MRILPNHGTIWAIFWYRKGYPLSTYIPGGRNAGRVEQVHGGVCRNVAEDIANVELRPTFVSLVDDTGSGQDVIDKLAKHKVNTKYIEKVPDGMGTWLAVFDNDGDVCAAISKRPDTTPLTRLLEEKGDEIFADCDGIAFELDLEKDTVKQLFAGDRLLRLQPAGGRAALLRRVRPHGPRGDVPHAGR